jgi:hypothetical protein
VPLAGPGISVNNPLLNPNSRLSGKPLYQAAQALTQAQTAGPISDAQAQITANNKQTNAAIGRVGGYFNQLGTQGQQALSSQADISNQLNAQLQGIGQNAQSQIAGIGLTAADQINKYSPQAYAGTSPDLSALVSEIARQRGLATQTDAAAQAAGATQSANYRGLSASNLGSEALAGVSGLQGLARAGTLGNQPLTQKIADLRETQGAKLATNLAAIRQQEITNTLTQQGLTGQNARAAATITAENQRSKAAINAANKRSQASINATNTRAANTITAANQRQQRSIDAANKKAAAGKAKPPLTANENNRYLTNLGTAVSIFGEGRQAKLAPQRILQALTTGVSPSGKRMTPINPVIAQAALELWTYHFLNPRTAKALHNMGVRGGTFQGRPIQVGGPPAGVGQLATGIATGVARIGNPFRK